jgi:hypothetical protein
MAKLGIMAYGTSVGPRQARGPASVENKSSSQWILERIRSEYNQVFGEVQPDPEAFKKGLEGHI